MPKIHKYPATSFLLPQRENILHVCYKNQPIDAASGNCVCEVLRLFNTVLRMVNIILVMSLTLKEMCKCFSKEQYNG